MRRFLWGSAVAFIWAFTSGVLASELTIPLGVFAAVLGALAGIFAGGRVGASRLRLSVVWCGGLSVLLLLALFARWATHGALVPWLLGPALAFRLGELLTWFGSPLIVVGLLRASTLRAQGFVVLELGAVGAVLAGVFAAHRGGFINRPYFLVDPLWARGYDPLPIFLAIGVGIAGLLAILAVHRGSKRRSFLDVALLFALLTGIFLVFPIGKLKDLPPLGGAGGQGKSSKEKGGGKPGDRAKGGAGPAGAQDKGNTSGNQGSTGGSGQSGGQSGSGPMSSFSNQQSRSSNSPVAVVLFHDDYDPPVGYYYFRQTAFSQWSGQRLIQDTSGRADLDVADAFPSKTVRLPSVQLPRESLPGKEGKPYFKTLDTTVALLASHSRPFLLINALSVSPKANPDPKRFQRAYDATSLVLARGLPDLMRRKVGSKAWGDELWRHYTEAPTDPRYAQLAAQVLTLLKPQYRGDPFAQALAVKLWMDHNTTYSLQSQHEQSTDPVSDFLFGDRTGHCVFLAHSACLLMRTLGVPARVGAGYAVEASNRGEGSSLMVREKDAHAWPEIYLEGLGWVPLDISPEKSLAPPQDAPDQGLQQMLGEMARQGAGNPKDEQKAAGRGDIQEAVKRILQGSLWFALVLLACLLALAYAVKVYRRLVPYGCGAPSIARLAYRGTLDRLAEAGLLRRFGQTRESFARAVSPVSPSFANLTVIHLDRALGRGRLSTSVQECRKLYVSVAREVRAGAPWWRRLLGLANPVSWVRVK